MDETTTMAALVGERSCLTREAVDHLKTLSEDDLVTLMDHPLDAVGISAAWQLYVRSCLNGKRGARGNVFSYDRFVGYCEGRLKFSMPSWWSSTSYTVASDDGSQHRIQLSAELEDLPLIALPKDRVVLWRSTAPQPRAADSLEALTGIAVDRTTIDELFSHNDICCVLNQDDQAFCLFLASHDPSPVRLLCIDQLTDQQKWLSDLRTHPDYYVLGGTGVGHHFCEVVRRGDDIVVVGASWIGLYIHKVDANSGKVMMSFYSF
jgi:hypothetical protein